MRAPETVPCPRVTTFPPTFAVTVTGAEPTDETVTLKLTVPDEEETDVFMSAM